MIDREARAAARQAARSQWKPTVATTIDADAVRVGDFIDVIPNQGNVRGVRCEATVTAIEPDDSWTERIGYRRRVAVPGVRFRFASTGAVVSVPADFIVRVRRVEVA